MPEPAPAPVPAPGPPPARRGSFAAWRWPLALVVVVVVLCLTSFLFYRETLRQAEHVAEVVGEVAARFWVGDVTERFVSSLPAVQAAEGGRLEVATLVATETFSRTDEQRLFWDWLPLGTVESEIQVPVTYRYHLRLADAWQVEIEDGVCTVRAPVLRPSLPPAIHTDGMVKRTTEGWLRFDGEEQLAELERGLTPRLGQMASDPRRVDQIREASRRAVAEFVETWLLREGQWEKGGVVEVRVVFSGEEEGAGGIGTRRGARE